MTVNINQVFTRQFLDRWAYLPGAIAGLLLLLIASSSAFTKILVDKRIEVAEEEPELVATLNLQPSKFGALRIDTKASFPQNHWVIYEISLIDPEGKIVASAMDEVWRESGIWREGGESGSWSESDLLSGLDIRAAKEENLDLVINILESGTTSGQPADLTVNFEVEVKNGVIKISPLLSGFFFSSFLAVMALIGTTTSGQKAIAKNIRDSDPQERATVGGADRLVKVKVKTQLDETTRSHAKIKLAIDNVYGERIYEQDAVLKVRLRRDSNKRLVGGIVEKQYFLILEPRSMYRFKVDVTPDNPVDSTSLIVRDGAKTLQGVNVVKIISS